MRCPRCNSEIKDSEKFCSKCGFQIFGNEQNQNEYIRGNTEAMVSMILGILAVFCGVMGLAKSESESELN